MGAAPPPVLSAQLPADAARPQPAERRGAVRHLRDRALLARPRRRRLPARCRQLLHPRRQAARQSAVGRCLAGPAARHADPPVQFEPARDAGLHRPTARTARRPWRPDDRRRTGARLIRTDGGIHARPQTGCTRPTPSTSSAPGQASSRWPRSSRAGAKGRKMAGQAGPSPTTTSHASPHAGAKPSARLCRGRAVLFLSLLMSLRGTIFLYQGEELGLPEADVPFEKLQDPLGVNGWPATKGRDGCRTPMPWKNVVNAGFTKAKEPWLPVDPRHKPLAAEMQDALDESTLGETRALIALRHTQPALSRGSFQGAGGEGRSVELRAYGGWRTPLVRLQFHQAAPDPCGSERFAHCPVGVRCRPHRVKAEHGAFRLSDPEAFLILFRPIPSAHDPGPDPSLRSARRNRRLPQGRGEAGALASFIGSFATAHILPRDWAEKSAPWNSRPIPASPKSRSRLSTPTRTRASTSSTRW